MTCDLWFMTYDLCIGTFIISITYRWLQTIGYRISLKRFYYDALFKCDDSIHLPWSMGEYWIKSVYFWFGDIILCYWFWINKNTYKQVTTNAGSFILQNGCCNVCYIQTLLSNLTNELIIVCVYKEMSTDEYTLLRVFSSNSLHLSVTVRRPFHLLL